MLQAARIAINRTVAGVHYPVDSAAGQLLGQSLAEFFIARCVGGNFNHWTFNGVNFPNNDDFFGNELFDLTNCQRRAPPNKNYASMANTPAVVVAPSNILGWLWNKAVDEWFIP
jgi:hypothetical protein